MAGTRREFLRSAALTMAAGSAAPAAAQQAMGTPRPAAAPAERRAEAEPPKVAIPASQVQVPKVRFAGVEISRMIVGCNPLYGFAHFNEIYASVMRDYYTPERVVALLHQCARFGINTYNYVDLGRAPRDLDRFQAEGGSMHLVVQGIGDPEPFHALRKPLAMYHHGGRTDRAYQDGKIATVREWCKRVRDLGCQVGVGTHKPEVIALVEEQGWDVDFYAGCVYNVTRTPDEWRKLLNGELPEMPSEVYVQGDPPRMFATMRKTTKPCFAFKILAAGRVAPSAVDEALTRAFASIKPTDAIFVGMFPFMKDEVRENAERVCRILGAARG